MARLNRLCPIGVAQHIIQCGNNRQVCFNGDEDMAAYANWLEEFSERYQVQIHAWVLMTTMYMCWQRRCKKMRVKNDAGTWPTIRSFL